jgi:predicted metal-dependent phosphoesterase TrpH
MIDLHCHSRISDGSFTIPELISLAKARGIEYISITDHDTVAGTREGLMLGKKKGVKVIPGVEISAFDDRRNRRVHILGYFFDDNNESIKNFCTPLLEERHHTSIKIISRLNELGYTLTRDDVEETRGESIIIYKQHILHALKNKGYTNELFGELNKELFSRGNNGKGAGKAFFPLTYLDAIEAVKAIQASGGIAVLAHPHMYNSWEIMNELISAGLKGIEAFHPSHTKEMEKKCIGIAEEYDLYITGGTDFHGMYENVPGDPGIENILHEKSIIHEYEKYAKGQQPPDVVKDRTRIQG